MAEKLILYDIAKRTDLRGWSPNTLKARFALRLKGISFTTIWVEFPDVEGVCKKVGASPTGAWPDGRPMYTLPVLQDPRTNTVISDSYAIVEHLDATYPTTRLLIPRGSAGFHAAFLHAVTEVGFMPLTQVFLPLIPDILNPRSAEYYRRTREEMLGLERLEDFCPKERRLEMLNNARTGFSVIKGWYDKSGTQFLMGGSPCWADIILASFLTAAKEIFGSESDEWRIIKTWDGGRWAHLLAAFVILAIDE